MGRQLGGLPAQAQGQIPSGVLPNGGGQGAVAAGTSGSQWTPERNSAFIQWVIANPGVDQTMWPGYTAEERASMGGNRPAAVLSTATPAAPAGGGPVVGPLATPSPQRNEAPMQNVPTLTAPTGPYPDATKPAVTTIPSAPFPGALFAGSNFDLSVVFWQDPATGALRSFNGTQELASNQNPAPAAPAAPAPIAPAPIPAAVLPGSSPVAAPVPTSQFAGGVAPDWLAAALRGESVSFDSGGVIPEEVIGIGKSGTIYRFGGSGPEVVSPLRTPGSAQQPGT